jgi:hypothetical protein
VRSSVNALVGLLIGLASVGLLADGSARAQAPTFPAGARTGLVAPPGFAPSTGFVGFQDEAGGAIVVGDLPRNTFDELLPTLTPAELGKGGIRTDAPPESWPVTEGEGRIVRGSQESRGVTYRRWLVLVRSRDGAAMVSAMVPEAKADAATPAIEAALRTISFRPRPSLADQIAALPFEVVDIAGFRPVQATGGLSLLLTEGPSDTPQAAMQPVVFLVMHGSGAQGGPDTRPALARQLFAKTPTVRGIAVTRAEDGAEISTLEGTATEAATGASVDVVQIIHFANGGYQRAVGVWRRGEAERWRARFERVATSIRPR